MSLKERLDQTLFKLVIAARIMNAVDAVSYTHLDVYKRQIYFHVDNGMYVITHGFTKKTETVSYTHLDVYVKNGMYVITHGFTKKTEKTPITEIKHTKELREEWFTNDD
ncbi:type II toxin-antitoxin system RelE/ParE family toxin [Enterococcus sp. 3C8_DIV0646]|uniref:type II toxin-antitoxin system RelE/ParE family toxin n=1 Tax=Enterococcus sp. 3C8_DIV0646 TaxID=1834175 RepID=UPI000B6A555A|nr:type II toxin-antitoxin system RelE/ParE family toxin [Enterococcus sp. 3C8_DIV0646]OTO22098.1 hypothetical protein A5876_003423 [Enterococcus sp. 3C8_DIV0646]